jgi:hypothetical protein
MTNAAYTAGIERGKAERKVEPPDASARIAQTLLWARENRFRVTQLSIGDVTIVLEDMGPEPGPSQGNPAREPSVGIVHGAWAQYLGIPMPDEEEEDGPEGPDPVEGAS